MNGDLYTQFSNALAEVGLSLAPSQIIADGTIQRFGCPDDKDKPCWYVLHPDGIAAGSFGCWKRGIKEDWCEKDPKRLSVHDRAAFNKRMDELKAQRKAYVRQEYKTAQIEAQKVWAESSPEAGDHPYLRKKGVLPHGIRTDGLNLIIPVHDVAGRIHSFQKIFPDGQKRFLSKGRISGCFFLIGVVHDVLYVCEGFSTGATIHELTGCPVAIAFAGNNLHAVVNSLKQRYSFATFIIAADDDRYGEEGKNPGLDYANAVVQAFDVQMVVPQFQDRRSKPTDFNDMRRLEGDAKTINALMRCTASKTFDISSVVSMDIPQRDCLLHPWLPAQGICMIHAPRGVGKTWFSLYLAYAISHGYGFLNWPVKHPHTVMYIDGEMPAAALQNRLKAIVASYENKTNGKMRVMSPDFQPNGMIDISNKDGHVRLRPLVEFAELIVIDNLSCLARSYNENEQESWVPIQEWALHQRTLGRTVLFLHHSGKSGKQRGTSRREDILDTVIHLKRPAGYQPSDGCKFEVHFEKSRGFYGEEAQSFEASLINDEHGRLQWVTQSIEQSLEEQLSPAI